MSDPFLSAADMADLEAFAESAMKAVVLVRRTTLVADGRGGKTQTTATVATTIGYVYALGVTPAERALADRLAGQAGYVVCVPVGTTVLRADVLVVGGVAYQVSEPLDETWGAMLRVVCVKD